MELTRTVRIEAQVELILPTELKTRLGESIVPQLYARPSFGQVRGVYGDLVANDARPDIFFVGLSEVFLGGYVGVARHRSDQ